MPNYSRSDHSRWLQDKFEAELERIRQERDAAQADARKWREAYEARMAALRELICPDDDEWVDDESEGP